MALVPYVPIENGQEGDQNLWNSRFLALHNAINGGLDSTNLIDNAVTSAKLAAGAVTTAKIEDRGATTAKVLLSPINSNFAAAGARFAQTTNGGFVDIPNCSMTYTTGPTNEKLYLFCSYMAYSVIGSSEIAISINGAVQIPYGYVETGTNWYRGVITIDFDAVANTLYTIKFIGKSNGTHMLEVANEANAWKPKITGFAVGRA